MVTSSFSVSVCSGASFCIPNKIRLSKPVGESQSEYAKVRVVGKVRCEAVGWTRSKEVTDVVGVKNGFLKSPLAVRTGLCRPFGVVAAIPPLSRSSGLIVTAGVPGTVAGGVVIRLVLASQSWGEYPKIEAWKNFATEYLTQPPRLVFGVGFGTQGSIKWAPLQFASVSEIMRGMW